uniref:Retrovirus-related Pol polyprotein from transposon TNT 1-94 n=1 Tax=Tanacetum cinerariifolium TaxID=118510 RepID=A0A699GRL6_TANCI|nr:hypothetical protein [Tanacetum cinerariifolium]
MAKVTLLTLKVSETYSRSALDSQVKELKIFHLKNKFYLSLEMLATLRDKGLDDVNVNYMYQPWRSFATIINRDDHMFNMIRVISRHQDTQVYDAILPNVLSNQEMLDSKAYKEYYAVASESIPLKAKTKYKKRTDEPVTSPKSKTAFASKEAKQIKLANKRGKKDFYISHASGSGDGVDTKSKVPNKQVQNISSTYEGTGTIPRVPDVPPYEFESDKESWGDSKDEDDNDNEGDNDDDAESNDHDERKESDSDEIPDTNLTNVDQTKSEEEDVDEGVYEDMVVNLEKGNAEMIDANQRGSEQLNVSQESGFEQEEEDAHVTLTSVSDTQKANEPIQISSISSNFTSKLLNLENPSLADNKIASLMETSAPYATTIPEIKSGFTTTTTPSPLFFNPILQQRTPTITTITPTLQTVTLPEVPYFASVFKFDQRDLLLYTKESYSAYNTFLTVVIPQQHYLCTSSINFVLAALTT